MYTSSFTGVKSDGSKKVRPIDHMTESLVNEATQLPEKLSMDTIDMLFESARALRSGVKVSFLGTGGVQRQQCYYVAGNAGIIQGRC